ncbi:purine-nucleoside phosphorylase [Echinimonas agarilytica]|uniref:Purine nucleoside phosphorylase DeoD-type n=1 Tax=Echinimonas agarilytica TaxID=1215918 RepID=A0AA41W6T6_9GAMM|nr:purine-nucleoside phosphorylase [Echinimonas agarilytica]MCM2679558.1 purine-nucleoside phosphorylase [Echinimonas agarilytica]
MSTPHIHAKAGDFADTVLMPGDPLRAKYIADTYLTNVKQVNSVRNMLGFTGEFKGQRVSVMGSGMGIPSISIYAKELYTEYGVKNIIRVGSCGAVQEDVKLRDVILAQGACTDSGANRTRFKGYDFAAIADFGLLSSASQAASKRGLKVHVGNVFSADLFYTPDTEMFGVMTKHQILAVEMEAAGLYGVAAEFGGKALSVLTVSDHILTGEQTTAGERETTFNDMMELTLDAVAE